MAEKVEKKPLINQACDKFVFALDKQEERKLSPAEYHGQPAIQKNAEKKDERMYQPSNSSEQ